MTIIAPSILAADFGEITRELRSIEQTAAKWLHIDVMDGNFVAPITFGDNMVRTAKLNSSLFLDVHLMIANPENKFQDFINAGADSITFHVEATKDIQGLITAIKKQGCQVGLTLKPETNINECLPYLDQIDLILVMSVTPGWGGQAYIPASTARISEFKKEILAKNLNTKIQVDGGINYDTAKLAVSAGADVLVAGTYIFKSNNRELAVEQLSQL